MFFFKSVYSWISFILIIVTASITSLAILHTAICTLYLTSSTVLGDLNMLTLVSVDLHSQWLIISCIWKTALLTTITTNAVFGDIYLRGHCWGNFQYLPHSCIIFLKSFYKSFFISFLCLAFLNYSPVDCRMTS